MPNDTSHEYTELARRLRRALRMGELTPEQAQAEYEAAEPVELSDAQIDALVEGAFESESPAEEPTFEVTEWSPEADTSDVESDVFQLNRNEGDADPEVDELVDKHRRKRLTRARAVKIPGIVLKTRRATEQAEGIIRSIGVTKPPIDPLEVVESEAPLLVARGDDFRDRFDGQLEYHSAKRRFLLLYNTKYDCSEGHHPRTRFSIAHELGHYFIEAHHAYLRGGGKAHPSRDEFASAADMEREADAFAAGVLMPTYLIGPRVNESDLSLARIRELADEFHTSLVSTAIRSVQCSHFPTAVAGIRDGDVLWQFQADCLVEAGCYPGARGHLRSSSANDAWRKFAVSEPVRAAGTSFVKDWFRTYDRDNLNHRSVTEEYLPVRSMGTLIVLLSIAEDELYDDDD